MEFGARGGIIDGVAPILMLLLLASPAAAQNPKPKDNYLKNIELCNGVDRTSPEARIEGCTALIGAGHDSTPALPIAYNNRGNAYTAKETTTAPFRISINRSSSIKLTPNPSTTAAWLT